MRSCCEIGAEPPVRQRGVRRIVDGVDTATFPVDFGAGVCVLTRRRCAADSVEVGGELMAQFLLTLTVTILIALTIAPTTALAQSSAAATLSVLAAPVVRVAAGSGASGPGTNGMNLAEGDRIKTAVGGIALITFLNGTTVTVLPGSEVTVKQAQTGRGQSGIRILIQVGRVWARVVQMVGGRTGLTLESSEYAASAHDGLIGAEQGPDGFVCWTRRGEVRLADRSGRANVVLLAGQRARARSGLDVTAEPFLASASVLEVRSSGPVVPLVRVPEGNVAAGFLATGVEVNQVFGSLTEGAGIRWRIEVPGGHAGPYTLVLAGRAAGAFKVEVSARYAGMTAYRHEIKGEIRQGEQLFTRITQDVVGSDPRTARVVKAHFEDLRTGNPDPAAAVVSPDLSAPGGN